MQLILTAEAFAVNILAGAGADRPRAYAAALGAPFAEKSHRGFDFYLSALGHIEPKRSAEDRAIDLAFAAFQSAAVEAFKASGSRDIGDCGGVMLGYRGNTRFAKALIARKIGRRMGGKVYVCLPLPSGVQTQFRRVQEQAYDAFVKAAQGGGFTPVEHYSYAD